MRVTRRALLRTALATTVGTAAGAGAYGFLYERHHLEVTRASIPVAGLPPALAGLRIGLLTDVHRGQFVLHDAVMAAVQALMGERPDLIVLGGDYVTWRDRAFVEPAADALGALAAPLGVYAILGNHDDDHDTAVALGARKIEVLRDARTSITVRGIAVDLLGIRFWTRKTSEIAALMRGATGFPILLAHDPRRLADAAALNIPLVLAGHTHGGQIVLPMVGAIAASKFPVASGLATRDRTSMFISRGVGTVYVPVRLNCPPEVAVLTLKPA